MPTSFHEILFPLDIALKSAGGPERKTEIVTTGSGREERNARWAHSRRRYDAGYGVKTFEALLLAIALFLFAVTPLLLAIAFLLLPIPRFLLAILFFLLLVLPPLIALPLRLARAPVGMASSAASARYVTPRKIGVRRRTNIAACDHSDCLISATLMSCSSPISSIHLGSPAPRGTPNAAAIPGRPPEP